MLAKRRKYKKDNVNTKIVELKFCRDEIWVQVGQYLTHKAIYG
jgi:hypothetical protein